MESRGRAIEAITAFLARTEGQPDRFGVAPRVRAVSAVRDAYDDECVLVKRVVGGEVMDKSTSSSL